MQIMKKSKIAILIGLPIIVLVTIGLASLISKDFSEAITYSHGAVTGILLTGLLWRIVVTIQIREQ